MSARRAKFVGIVLGGLLLNGLLFAAWLGLGALTELFAVSVPLRYTAQMGTRIEALIGAEKLAQCAVAMERRAMLSIYGTQREISLWEGRGDLGAVFDYAVIAGADLSEAGEYALIDERLALSLSPTRKILGEAVRIDGASYRIGGIYRFSASPLRALFLPAAPEAIVPLKPQANARRCNLWGVAAKGRAAFSAQTLGAALQSLAEPDHSPRADALWTPRTGEIGRRAARIRLAIAALFLVQLLGADAMLVRLWWRRGSYRLYRERLQTCYPPEALRACAPAMARDLFIFGAAIAAQVLLLWIFFRFE